MEFIRSENVKPDHDSNTRHCLYGLDADLVGFVYMWFKIKFGCTLSVKPSLDAHTVFPSVS